VYAVLPGGRGACSWVRRFVIRRDRTIIIVLGLAIGATSCSTACAFS
jgi:hypothetical protein